MLNSMKIYLVGHKLSGESLEFVNGFLYPPFKRTDISDLIGYSSSSWRHVVVGPRQSVICSLLKENGYHRYLSFTDGSDFLEHLERSSDRYMPDFVFVYKKLPDMHGIELARRLRETERKRKSVQL